MAVNRIGYRSSQKGQKKIVIQQNGYDNHRFGRKQSTLEAKQIGCIPINLPRVDITADVMAWTSW